MSKVDLTVLKLFDEKNYLFLFWKISLKFCINFELLSFYLILIECIDNK